MISKYYDELGYNFFPSLSLSPSRLSTMSSRNRPPTTDYQGYPQSRPGVDLPRYNDVTGPEQLPPTSGDETDGEHRRLSTGDESDASSINEDLEVASITSSIEDQLT